MENSQLIAVLDLSFRSMSALQKFAAPAFAIVVGVVSGIYIFDAPLKAAVEAERAARAQLSPLSSSTPSNPAPAPAEAAATSEATTAAPLK